MRHRQPTIQHRFVAPDRARHHGVQNHVLAVRVGMQLGNQASLIRVAYPGGSFNKTGQRVVGTEGHGDVGVAVFKPLEAVCAHDFIEAAHRLRFRVFLPQIAQNSVVILCRLLSVLSRGNAPALRGGGGGAGIGGGLIFCCGRERIRVSRAVRGSRPGGAAGMERAQVICGYIRCCAGIADRGRSHFGLLEFPKRVIPSSVRSKFL